MVGYIFLLQNIYLYSTESKMHAINWEENCWIKVIDRIRNCDQNGIVINKKQTKTFNMSGKPT